MVQCQYCKVHLPQADALTDDKRFYCSKEHRNALDEQGWIGAAAWRVSPNQDVRPDEVKPDLLVIHHISLPPGEFKSQTSSQNIVSFFQNTLDVNAHPYFAEIANQGNDDQGDDEFDNIIPYWLESEERIQQLMEIRNGF